LNVEHGMALLKSRLSEHERSDDDARR
jgi:hypothetical protein